MIPKALPCGSLLKDTICLIDGIPYLKDRSSHRHRWLVGSSEMHGAANLHAGGVTKNCLYCSSFSGPMDTVIEGIEDEGTEVRVE